MDMKEQMLDEFDDTTMVNGARDKVSLFSLAVKQQQAQVAVHTRKAVVQRRGSIIKSRYSPKKSPHSKFILNGKMQSSQHLLAITKNPKSDFDDAEKIKMASQLYIPENKRILKSQKAAVKVDLMKVKKDEEARK